ncbi:MAG: hypothetical protein JXA60_08555 [Candidatus Coatesbacteria bacterium]|nr:hypothetical protein [Candidatus Coatesbacteria bacterium]
MKLKTALIIIGIYAIISAYILIKGDTDPLIHIEDRLKKFKDALPSEVRDPFEKGDYDSATIALEEIHTKAILYKIGSGLVEHQKKTGKFVDKIALLEDEIPFAISYRNPVNNEPLEIKISEDGKTATISANFKEKESIKIDVSELEKYKPFYEKMQKIDIIKDEEGINIFTPKEVILFFKDYFVDKLSKKK